MIYRILLFLTLFLCLGINVYSAAETNNPTAVDLVLKGIKEQKQLSPALLIQASLEKTNPEKRVNDMLTQLLNVPVKQRQYIYPALFDFDNLPHKISTHPEIRIWKGRLPTDIAPHMRAFADKYLEDLNPRLYFILSPDIYQQGNRDIMPDIKRLNASLQSAQPTPEDSSDFMGYKTLESYLTLPPDLIKNPNQSKISNEDIDKLGNGLFAINVFLDRMEKKDPMFPKNLELLRVFYTDPEEQRINPFQSLAERIRYMGEDKTLDKIVHQAGWQDLNTLAQALDTTAKAYRANTMDLALALELRRYKNIKTPKNTQEQIMITTAKMYEALPADIEKIDKRSDEILLFFKKNGYERILDPVSLDDYEKIDYNTDQFDIMEL